MPSGRELPALAMAVLVAFAATLALAAPGTAAVGNQPTATPAPSTPDAAPTPNVDPRNATGRNDSRESQVFKPGPDRGPRQRPTAPRVRATVIVDDDGKSHFDTLAAAVEHARPGQIIAVRPGNYGGAVDVDVDNLTLVGFGPAGTVVGNGSAGVAVTVSNATNVTVRSMVVDGGLAVSGNGSAVTLTSLDVEGPLSIQGGSLADVRVEDATVRGGLTVEATGGGSVRSVRVIDVGLAGAGLRLEGAISDVRVERSAVSGADRGFVVAAGNYSSVAFVDNDVAGNDVGVVLRDGVDAAAVEVHGNTFIGNDVGLRSAAAGTLDAERNAWGARSGPETAENPSGTGDSVRGDVDVDPWIPAVVRLEDARAEGGVVTVDLVAHSERLAGYEVVVSYPPAAVDAVAVDGRAMPAEAVANDGEVTITGSADDTVSGPVVLATLTLSGDLDGAVGELGLDGDRSSAVDPSGEPLGAAFLTGELEVVASTETPAPPTATPTPTGSTETATPEPTATEGPPTVEPPPTPTEPGDREPPTMSTPTEAGDGESPDPPGWRSVPTDLPAIGEAVVSRLVAVLRALL